MIQQLEQIVTDLTKIETLKPNDIETAKLKYSELFRLMNNIIMILLPKQNLSKFKTIMIRFKD